MTAWRLCCVLLGASLVVSAAAGQEPPPSRAEDVARNLFEAGRAAYDAGDYREALELFQRAYEHSDRPRLLYNIGQSADRLRMDRTALAAFRRYLELVSEADNRVEVENRINALSIITNDDPTVVSESSQTDGPTREPIAPDITSSTSQPAPADSSKSSKIAPWITLAISGAAAVTGVVLFAVGSNRINNVESARDGSRWTDHRDQASSGPTLRDVGVTSLVLGLIGSAAGAVWLLSANDDAIDVALGPTSIAVRGTL